MRNIECLVVLKPLDAATRARATRCLALEQQGRNGKGEVPAALSYQVITLL